MRFFCTLFILVCSHLYCDYFSDKTIPHPERLAIKRYELPKDHEAQAKLDAIFARSRAIVDEMSFLDAGFIPIDRVHKNKITVARHPDIPGYIVKTFFDRYPVNKCGDPDWLCLSRRCQLVRRIGKVIKKEKAHHFTVPQKWLYPIPKKKNSFRRVNMLLIEEDMDLVSLAKNKEAWEAFPYSALDQLLDIMLKAGGKSYRPDNVWMTKSGKFAFIDTEYPHLTPKLHELFPYLTSERADYWKQILGRKILAN